MNSLDALNAITRRALRINYRSPAVCIDVSGVPPYGSGSGIPSTLDFDPVFRKPGPSSLTATVDGMTVTLEWSSLSYAFSYFVYEANTPEGPFNIIVNGTHETSFSYAPGPGAYFYKVTAIEPDAGETLPSSTIGPIIVTI